MRFNFRRPAANFIIKVINRKNNRIGMIRHVLSSSASAPNSQFITGFLPLKNYSQSVLKAFVKADKLCSSIIGDAFQVAGGHPAAAWQKVDGLELAPKAVQADPTAPDWTAPIRTGHRRRLAQLVPRANSGQHGVCGAARAIAPAQRVQFTPRVSSVHA